MRALSSTNVCFCWASAALLALAVGCGGDDSSSSTTKGPGGSGGSGATGGSDPTGGSGGSTGGTGGTGATAGTGGSSGGVPDGGVPCGTTVCPPPMFGMACCTMQNTCGFALGMTCIDPGMFDAGSVPEAGTGVPDPNCGSATIGPFMLAGCCMTDNTCGFVSQFGGCVTADTLRMFPGAMLPDAPMSCVYPPP